ncbi:hypothetical protein [Candidatus Protochlamydia phocaeensis]|uniref:hypothetical protein n=1 Tax=Candidatus Protochlamydia phocaeensis TaxID=1414722 RepID=UPI0008399AD9|nr:hypothetical protein [Candidatus Protochlamydia phocaeensis]
MGQAYAKSILDRTSQIIDCLTTIQPEEFGEYGHVIDKLSQLKGQNATIDQIATLLNINRQEAVEVVTGLWAKAQNTPKLELVQDLQSQIEKEVADSLNIKSDDIIDWLSNIEKERQLKADITRLGEERVDYSSHYYSTNYEIATKNTFDKHHMDYISSGVWTLFSKGPVPADKNPDLQWKLFLNPKSSDFQPTLD